MFSTGLLNWVTTPYVVDMLLEDDTRLHLRTRTLFGRSEFICLPRYHPSCLLKNVNATGGFVDHQFPLSDVGPKIGSHPFANFSGDGASICGNVFVIWITITTFDVSLALH